MKLKCIGGPNDGKDAWTYDDKPRVGECVRVRIPKQVVAETNNILRIPTFDYRDSELIVDDIVMYIVDRDNDGLFLRLV